MSVKSGFHNECEETASVDELRAIQTERLRAVVRHVYDHNTTQRARFREAGVTPGDIRDLSDLRRIPTMDKVLFGTSYPLGLSCVDKKYVV